MTNLIVREWLNAALIPLNACILVIIAHSLYESCRLNGKGWVNSPGVKSACALWWIFLADLIRASMAWTYLNAQNSGDPLEFLGYAAAILYLAAAAIATLATFRLIYALSPTSWGHKGWATAAILTGAFVFGVGLYL